MLTIENPIFIIDAKTVTEKEFFDRLDEFKHIERKCDPTHAMCLNMSKDQTIEWFNNHGELAISPSLRSYEKHYFIITNSIISDIEDIVVDNQYDPEYGDSFSIAFALYKAGYKK